jgi:hypothetical protein
MVEMPGAICPFPPTSPVTGDTALVSGRGLEHRHLLSPNASRIERVRPPLALYAFRRTVRFANAPGPREAARRLFDARAAR